MDQQSDVGVPTGAARLSRLKTMTENADVASARDREAALELELRGLDGSRIETEWIALQDTEFLLSLGDGDFSEGEYDEDWYECDELSAVNLSDFGDDDDVFDETEPWSDDFDVEWTDEPEKPFPRYQIFVSLVNDDAVP